MEKNGRSKMIHPLTIPPYQTMTEIAADFIRERVLSGQYPSGSRLIPEKLESEIGLGRVAIREALRELAGSGLVVLRPNKGVLVADPPQPDEIKTIYEARFALEGETAYQAAKQITPVVIGRMEKLAEEMEKTEKAPFHLILLNREFHLTLYEVSGWKAACRMIRQLLDQTLIYRAWHTAWKADNPSGFHKDHRAIIRSLKCADVEAVKKNVIANIGRGLNQYILAYGSGKKKENHPVPVRKKYLSG
jgi:DNA-binding GntR family transcriptional regulator